MAKPPTISVVIPAYNEATYVGRLLDALCKQNFSDFEVIVSDAQSNDGTAELVDSFKDRLRITLVESPPKGPAAGRNIGAAKAMGEWLLFLDADDDIDDPNFIATILSVTQKNSWQSSTVKMKLKDASLQERLGTFMNYRYIKLLSHTKHPVAPGWCIFTRRSVFEQHGGFNEKLQLSEDYDYISRVGAQGFGFVESTSYILDLRRLRSEGLRFVIKMTRNEIYRHTHGYNMEKTPIRYEFGKHKSRTDIDEKNRPIGQKLSNHKLLIQLFEYLIGGGVYFWTGLAVFAVCYSALHWNILVAKVLADIIGWTLNYVIQRYWAFYDKRLDLHEGRVRFRYILINSIDFVIDYSIVLGLKHVGVTPYISFFVSAGFTTVWDYLWYRFWVFKPST